MLRGLLGALVSWFSSNSVDSRIKNAIKLKVREAQKRANEDIEFHKEEMNRKIEAAFAEFVEGKESAIIRQANAILSRISQ